MSAAVEVRGLSKTFTLHNQGGARIDVLERADLAVVPGECVGLTGASGSGKSTLLRMLAGNYLATGGSVRIMGIEMVGAPARTLAGLRRDRLGHVSQFLRVVPRVPARDVVAEPLLALGSDPAEAGAAAEALLGRLNLPRRLRDLSPTTFSGGEQQHEVLRQQGLPSCLGGRRRGRRPTSRRPRGLRRAPLGWRRAPCGGANSRARSTAVPSGNTSATTPPSCAVWAQIGSGFSSQASVRPGPAR